MHFLAIDYGTRCMGLAYRPAQSSVILPFGEIFLPKPKKNEEEKIYVPDDLVKRIAEQPVDQIIVGLPFTLEDGSENKNTKRIRAFGALLEKTINIPVEYIDERLSSYEADEMGGLASRDEKAAMLILESYLQETNNK